MTAQLRKAERAYVLTLYRNTKTSSSSPTSNAHRFWDFMRSLSGKSHRPPLPDLQSDSSHLLSSASEKAEALNAFFAQQTYLPNREREPDTSGLEMNASEFSTLHTSASEVYDILSALPARKAPALIASLHASSRNVLAAFLLA